VPLYGVDVEHAYETAKNFNAAGIAAACIEGAQKHSWRDDQLQRFRDGELKVLTNVYVLTEGIDVPDASVCILARQVGHASTYLQMAGRVLRPARGKTHGLILDLTGASLRFGLPTEAREYSLDGEAIRRHKGEKPLKACPFCWATFPADGRRKCPECGAAIPLLRKEVRIYNEDLKRVYAGAKTPDDAKNKELARLRSVASTRGFSAGWTAREYKKLFGEYPAAERFTTDELAAEWRRILAIARKSYGRKYALARFRAVFGCWPDRRWT